MDIADVILRQHDEQRWLFGVLDQIDDADTEALTAVWRRLALLLESHADSEEAHVYPALLAAGGGRQHVADETRDAIKDHNEIRDAVDAARGRPVGSQEWRDAVAEGRRANSEHMAEEERDDLPDLRRLLPLEQRHRVAVRFLAQQAAQGLAGPLVVDDKDPDEYVERHTPEAGRS